METESTILILILAGSLLLSMLLPGIETALLTLTHTSQKELKKTKSKRAARLHRLLQEATPFFISIQGVILVCNAAAVVSVTLLLQELDYMLPFAFPWTALVALLFMVGLWLLAHVVWAHTIALRYSRSLCEFFSLPLMLYFTVAKPFATLLARLQSHLSARFTIAKKQRLLDRYRLLALVDHHDEVTELKEKEREMITSILGFSDTEVREIMVPRIDMVCVEENTSIKELTRLIKEKGHSRIPVYQERIDNIIGILYAKDLLPYLLNDRSKPISLRNLVRPASFVPESKKLHQLLREFQQRKYHMAIVVDEYGGTAGLVTLEDIIEEIVGDIQDEYDRELPLYRKIDDRTYLVDAKIDMHELNEKLGLDLPTEGEFESLGGFIFSLTGYVPEKNEVVKYENYTFTVLEVDRNRIVKVKLVREEEMPEGEHAQEENA